MDFLGSFSFSSKFWLAKLWRNWNTRLWLQAKLYMAELFSFKGGCVIELFLTYYVTVVATLYLSQMKKLHKDEHNIFTGFWPQSTLQVTNPCNVFECWILHLDLFGRCIKLHVGRQFPIKYTSEEAYLHCQFLQPHGIYCVHEICSWYTTLRKEYVSS